MEKLKGGWLKLHRQLKDWKYYSDTDVFKVFIHILLTANIKEDLYQNIKISAGQLVFGRRTFSRECGLTEWRVRASIVKLKNSKEILVENFNNFSRITVIKWSEFQGQNSDEKGSKKGQKSPPTPKSKIPPTPKSKIPPTPKSIENIDNQNTYVGDIKVSPPTPKSKIPPTPKSKSSPQLKNIITNSDITTPSFSDEKDVMLPDGNVKLLRKIKSPSSRKKYQNIFNKITEWADEFGNIFAEDWIPIERDWKKIEKNLVIIERNDFQERLKLTMATTKSKTFGSILDATVRSYAPERRFSDASERIYTAYPQKCPVGGRSLGKNSSHKAKIDNLLRTYGENQLITCIEMYIQDCEKHNIFLKNFETFLNKPPDIESIGDISRLKLEKWDLITNEMLDGLPDDYTIGVRIGREDQDLELIKVSSLVEISVFRIRRVLKVGKKVIFSGELK